MKYKKYLSSITGDEKANVEYELLPQRRERSSNVIPWLLGLLIAGYLLAALIFNAINYQFLKPVKEISTEKLSYKFFVSKKEAYRGEPIKMTLLIINRTDEPIALYFESEKKYEFIVKRVYHLGLFNIYLDVWRSSFGKVYKKVPQKIVIEPKQVLKFSEVWDQRLPDGRLAPPGDYLFLARLYFVKGKRVTLHTTGE